MVKIIQNYRINRLKKLNHKSFHNKYSEYRLKIYNGSFCGEHLKIIKDSIMSKNYKLYNKITKKIKIILYSEIEDGFGDILFLNKIANILHRYIKQNKLNLMIIITFNNQYLKKFKSVASPLIRKCYRPLDDINYELIFRGRFTKNILIQVATPNPYIKFANCQYIFIDEYNGHRSINFQQEFENNGIHIVSGIGNNHLKDCSGIIFETFENEYGSLIQKYKNKIVSELDNYFFAYSSSSSFSELKYFFEIVISHYKKSTFLIVWQLGDREIIEFFSDIIDNFHNVKIIKVMGNSTQEFIINNCEDCKINDDIVIYLVNFLHPIQFTYALKKSNDLVMITGDQSLSEAIKFNKLIIYQCQEGKIRLFEQYLIFVDFVLGKKSLLYNFIIQQYDKFITSDCSFIKKVPKININYLLHNMDTLKKEIMTVNTLLYKNYNIEHVLLNQINLLLKK